MNDWKKLSYLSLSTKKRDGSWVNTPVWFAINDDKFYCFSEGKAGKVKRLKNFSDIRIAPCTVTGKVTGQWQDGTGILLTEPQDEKTAHKALIQKYGIQMRILDLLSWVSGKKKKRAFIKIEAF